MSLKDIIDFLRYLDTELYYYIDQFGYFIYVLLFLIVYCKTAFVILTFLPGDSSLFTSGTLAALNHLNVWLLFVLFFVATSLADSQNYLIGRLLEKLPKIKTIFMKYLPNNAVDRAHHFLVTYGKIAITFSRFVPLMRTMTPFISGYSGYSYRKFAQYNVLGAFIWTCVWLGGGYALGNIPWVANNLLLTLSLITLIVLAPTIFAYIRQMKKMKTA